MHSLSTVPLQSVDEIKSSAKWRISTENCLLHPQLFSHPKLKMYVLGQTDNLKSADSQLAERHRGYFRTRLAFGHGLEMKVRQQLLGTSFGAGAGAMWGLVFLAPEAVSDFRSIDLVVGRFLAFGAISAFLLVPKWRSLTSNLSRRDWITLSWLALAGNTIYYFLLSSAVQAGGIATTSLVIGFLPVTITLVGSLERGAVPLRRLLPSLLLCSAGLILIARNAIASSSPQTFPSQTIGLLLAVAALISWTSYAVGNTRSLSRLSHLSVLDWNLLLGLLTGLQVLCITPVLYFFGSGHHQGADWARLAGVSIGVALLASLVGNDLWNRMSRLLPLTLIGQMILFETLFALIYGYLWEQRFPTIFELAAFALVVSSVMLCIAAHGGHRRRTGGRSFVDFERDQ
jgi:drug/metabolite transporter (DMT)-like permease